MHPKASVYNYLWNCVVRYHKISYVPYEMESWGVIHRKSSQHWDLIHHVHYLVTTLWVLDESLKLKDIENLLEWKRNWRGEFMYENHPWSPWYNPNPRRYSWRPRSHEQRTKYVRKPHHEKKQLTETEICKIEWRKKKKGKHRPTYRRRSNPGPVNKRIEHRAMRRWVKERLHEGDWDLEKGYKWRHTDPWDWD